MQRTWISMVFFFCTFSFCFCCACQWNAMSFANNYDSVTLNFILFVLFARQISSSILLTQALFHCARLISPQFLITLIFIRFIQMIISPFILWIIKDLCTLLVVLLKRFSRFFCPLFLCNPPNEALIKSVQFKNNTNANVSQHDVRTHYSGAHNFVVIPLSSIIAILTILHGASQALLKF